MQAHATYKSQHILTDENSGTGSDPFLQGRRTFEFFAGASDREMKNSEHSDPDHPRTLTKSHIVGLPHSCSLPTWTNEVNSSTSCSACRTADGGLFA